MKDNLPDSLSRRIQHLRELNNLSVEELADASNLDVSVITDIEEGKDIFLSVTTRQKLSKALKVPSMVLKEVEKPLEVSSVDTEAIELIKYNILQGKLDNQICPKCGNTLICKIVTLLDLDNIPVKHPKAKCTKCPFQIK